MSLFLLVFTLFTSFHVVKESPRTLAIATGWGRFSARVSYAPRRLPRGSIVITANYYDGGQPIGPFVSKGKCLPSIPFSGRPSLIITLGNTLPCIGSVMTMEYSKTKGTIVTGGPWLVKKGKLFCDNGHYSQEVYKVCTHTGIGIKWDSTLLLIYEENCTLKELGKTFVALGAEAAMNLDGDSSAHLSWGKYRRGRKLPMTALILEPR